MRRTAAVSLAAILLLAAMPQSQANVSLRVNLRAETADITNNGDTELDLTGWTLVSVTGGQRFTFPSMTLAAKATVTVTSGSNARHDPPRYIRWTRRNVWNNDGDPGELYDAEGRRVARTRVP